MRERGLIALLCKELLSRKVVTSQKVVVFFCICNDRYLYLSASVLRDFSTILQKMFSVTNIGGWVLEIPMPHYFETRLSISTMSFGMFVTKIIKSIVFIATIIIMTANQQNKLASPFKFKAIS